MFLFVLCECSLQSVGGRVPQTFGGFSPPSNVMQCNAVLCMHVHVYMRMYMHMRMYMRMYMYV
jgi:hypothetical protein